MSAPERLSAVEMAELFARANAAADIEKIAGTKLKRSGSRMRGPCPLCGGDKDSTRFWCIPSARRWGCFGACPRGGDAVELYAQLNRMSPLEAARYLAGVSPAAPRQDRQAPAAPRPVAPASDGDDDLWKAAMAAVLWREARPAAGSPVETYLVGRGFSGEVLGQALRQLRFHPAAYHHGPIDTAALKPLRGATTAPAMIGLVRTPLGPTGGGHVTYLGPGGRGKAALTPAKRMWGPQGHLAEDGVRLPGGVWLTHPAAPGKLVVGEGIESTGSAAILTGGPCRVVATLSLRALQGGWLADKWGRVDPDLVKADPERPAFTWPEPAEQPWGVVIIAVDRDMKPVTVKVRKPQGGTAERQIEAEARARICAGLAETNWRRAGAASVRVIGPRAGFDFNNELMARLAEAQGRAA